jgi:hypothetical protein
MGKICKYEKSSASKKKLMKGLFWREMSIRSDLVDQPVNLCMKTSVDSKSTFLKKKYAHWFYKHASIASGIFFIFEFFRFIASTFLIK